MNKKWSLLSLALWAAVAPAETLHEHALRVQRESIVVDTHEDVPDRLGTEWVDLGMRQKTGHVDISRLKEGGVTNPFFAAYVPAEFAAKGGSAKKALEQIELVHRLVESHPELVFADSPAAVRAAKKDGKIAVSIGIEGGHAIEDSLGALQAFYRLGVRYMTLTHTNTNHWADSSGSFFQYRFEPAKYAVHNGLTDFGREVVLEMNRLGMLVDVSHVSDKTAQDAIAISKAPVFASHSSCRALADMPRNVTDEEIRAIASKGGVVMVNFSSTFLDQKVVDEYKAKKAALAPEVARLTEQYKGDSPKRDAEVAKLVDAISTKRASWTTVVDHIEHVMKVGGPQAAGLGTDYDGMPNPPDGLEDVSKLLIVTEELVRRGHSDEEVRGVLGENFMRFWERADAARGTVPPRTGPPPFSKP
ncbi:MAG TPA: dipeptidase [Thermoanaerobaculia bacterium]